MSISEERISHLSHKILEQIWRDDLADCPDERRTLECVKQTITAFFRTADELDDLVRAKLKSKTPGSREYDILYHKYYQEEQARRKW